MMTAQNNVGPTGLELRAKGNQPAVEKYGSRRATKPLTNEAFKARAREQGDAMRAEASKTAQEDAKKAQELKREEVEQKKAEAQENKVVKKAAARRPRRPKNETEAQGSNQQPATTVDADAPQAGTTPRETSPEKR